MVRVCFGHRPPGPRQFFQRGACCIQVRSAWHGLLGKAPGSYRSSTSSGKCRNCCGDSQYASLAVSPSLTKVKIPIWLTDLQGVSEPITKKLCTLFAKTPARQVGLQPSNHRRGSKDPRQHPNDFLASSGHSLLSWQSRPVSAILQCGWRPCAFSLLHGLDRT